MSAYQDVGISVDSYSARRSRANSKHNRSRYQESSGVSEENEFLRAYNHSPASNNSFAFPSPVGGNYKTINVSKLSEREGQSPGSSRKKSLIEQLQQKNEMLKKEVDRVQKILNRGDRTRSLKLPQLDGNVMKKQLENAYKQIKFYQVDISYRQKLYEHEGAYIQKIRKAEKILIQRQQLVKKLVAEISEAKKQSGEYTKLLQDGHIKKQYANKTSKLHKQIKFYQTQLKEEEQLALTDYYNSEQKNKRIFEMEQQLMNSGLEKGTIFNMKKQFDSNQKANRSTVSRVSNDVYQDRSKKVFDSLKGQIATLKKMQKDYAKKMQQLQQQREEAEFRARQSKLRLQSAEKQLQQLQQSFASMKKKIDPNKLKPLIKSGSFFQSSITMFNKGKGNPLEHRFQTVELGEFGKKSTPVNDRLVIGKKSAFIVELTLYQNRTQFLGFQATYLIGEVKKKGGFNVLKKENERFMKDKSLKLQPGDYFKTFECALSSDNIITGFLGLSMSGQTIKCGLFDGMKKDLQIKDKEYPCCLYGSYSSDGFEMIGIEKVQPE